MLRKMYQKKPTDRDRYITANLFGYREVPQFSLYPFPFELPYGKRMSGSLAILEMMWTNEALSAEMKSVYSSINLTCTPS